MLIALLAVLGVDLIVIVALVGAVIARNRWVKHQDGTFRGAIRLESGDLDGLSEKWRRGHGRWVRDVLVWTNGPLNLTNHAIAVDAMAESSATGEPIRRLGDAPVSATLTIGGATAEIAARSEDHDVLLTSGPKPVSEPLSVASGRA